MPNGSSELSPEERAKVHAGHDKLYANFERIRKLRKKKLHELIDKAPVFFLEYLDKIIYRYGQTLHNFYTSQQQDEADRLSTILMNTVNETIAEEKRANLF